MADQPNSNEYLALKENRVDLIERIAKNHDCIVPLAQRLNEKDSLPKDTLLSIENNEIKDRVKTTRIVDACIDAVSVDPTKFQVLLRILDKMELSVVVADLNRFMKTIEVQKKEKATEHEEKTSSESSEDCDDIPPAKSRKKEKAAENFSKAKKRAVKRASESKEEIAGSKSSDVPPAKSRKKEKAAEHVSKGQKHAVKRASKSKEEKASSESSEESDDGPPDSIRIKSSPDDSYLKESPTMSQLMNIIRPKIIKKRNDFGIFLKLKEEDLDVIDADKKSNAAKFQLMFLMWQRTNCSPYNWSTVANALKKMGNERLARNLKEEINNLQSWIEKLKEKYSRFSCCEPKLCDLLEHVGPFGKEKYDSIGIELGLGENEVEQIAADDEDDKLMEVFDVWKRSMCSEYSWQTLLVALSMPQVGLEGEAERISQAI